GFHWCRIPSPTSFASLEEHLMTAESGVSEQLRVLTQLQDLSLKLGATQSLDEALDAIVDAAMVICRADRAAISCINESGDLRILKHRGLSEEYIKQRQMSALDPNVSAMMATRRPSIVEDINAIANSPNYPALKKEGIASIVTLPLISEREVFGVIGAGSFTP